MDISLSLIRRGRSLQADLFIFVTIQIPPAYGEKWEYPNSELMK